MNDISIIPVASNLLASLTPGQVFKPGGVADVIDLVEREARAASGDVSTPAGRKAIASAAYKVARAKTFLDDMGKKLTDEWRARTDAVNADRRTIRTTLDALADEVRRPVTVWEDAEKARISGHETALAEIVALAAFPFDASSADLSDRIGKLGIGDNRDWQEFKDRASDARATAFDALNAALAQSRAREEQAAELARLRAAAEEQARADAARKAAERDAKIAADAAEKARLAAEEDAQRRERAAADAERARAERERSEAQAAIARAEDRARRAEAEKAEAAERAERERVAAVDAERVRKAREEQAERDEAARREANRAHRSKVNNAAAAGLMTAGLDEATAKAVVAAIARREIPHVSIAY
jgi:colicin import membrane protein